MGAYGSQDRPFTPQTDCSRRREGDRNYACAVVCPLHSGVGTGPPSNAQPRQVAGSERGAAVGRTRVVRPFYACRGARIPKSAAACMRTSVSQRQ